MLGLIIAPDGWIATKASELPDGPIVCKLFDGRFLAASVEGISSEHDLALLRIDATELPVPEWSDRPPEVGMIVATIGSEPLPQRVGTVSTSVHDVPKNSAPRADRPVDPDAAAIVLKLTLDLHGRRDGFPAVFTHDASIRRPQPLMIGMLAVSRNTLGSPVVGTMGKVIGINIGSLDGYLTFAIPADVVRKVVQELRHPTPKDQK